MNTDEFCDSLTGYEEIAIKEEFGAKPAELGEYDVTGLIRALYFVARKRDGLRNSEAKKAALEATLGEVNAMFTDDEEPFPEDPITESGKDEQPNGLTTSDSLTSSSEPESNPPSTQP